MHYLKRGLLILGGFSLVMGATLDAVAADSADVKELMAVIESLKKRVSELESKLETDPGLQTRAKQRPASQPLVAPSSLEARVEKLETMAEPDPSDFRVYWKSGLNMKSNDGKHKLKIGGRIHNDWAWFDESSDLRRDFGHQEDGTEIRRARLYMSGTLYGNVNFKVDYDFAGGDSDLKDVFIELAKIPAVGKLRLGHFKEPFGLEQLTSGNYITFIERSLPDAFVPGRNTGVMLHNAAFDDRLFWAVGAYHNADDFGNGQEDGAYSVTGRVAGTPWIADEGRNLVHLGLALSKRDPAGDSSRFRARPEAHLSRFRYVDTGVFDVDEDFRWGLEAALVYGPFSVQGEYITASLDTPSGTGVRDPDFNGWYAMASWFATGERRPYKGGTFARVKPKNNFNPWADGGWGAVELALRYSSLDLDDGGILGGDEDNFTAAVNWYLNPNTRMMLNYVHADVDYTNGGESSNGDLDILQARFQIDF